MWMCWSITTPDNLNVYKRLWLCMLECMWHIFFVFSQAGSSTSTSPTRVGEKIRNATFSSTSTENALKKKYFRIHNKYHLWLKLILFSFVIILAMFSSTFSVRMVQAFILVANYPVDEQSCRRNVLSAKRHVGELSCRWTYLSVNCPVGEPSCRRNVLSANCPVNETSCRRTVLSAKFPVGELSCRRNFLSANCPIVLSKNCPVGELSGRRTVCQRTVSWRTVRWRSIRVPCWCV